MLKNQPYFSKTKATSVLGIVNFKNKFLKHDILR